MSDLKYSLSLSQQKLIETFRVSAGADYIGKMFTLGRQGENLQRFSYITQTDKIKVEFTVHISDSDIFGLAQQGYLLVYTNPPSINFTEKMLEKQSSDANTPRPPNYSIPTDPHSQVLTVDIIQIKAWLIASLIAAAISMLLLVLAIQQLLNQNIPIGIVSGLSTIATGFTTSIFFKNYDKANERVKRLRSNPTTTKIQDKNL
jgi:hypothetical protein